MKSRFIILIFIAAAIGFSSCKNNDNVFAPNASSLYKVINASADTLNYFLNGTRQNNGSSLVPGGATFYLVVPSGNENFQFKKNNATDVLFSVPEKLKDSLNYSLYISGTSGNQTFGSIDTFNPDTTSTIDTLTQARLVHAASDFGNIDVYVGDTLKYQNSKFQSTSDFLTFGKGLKRIRIYPSGGSILDKARLDTTFTMTDHSIYTIYTHGLKDGKGASKFNVAITLNYQN